MPRPGPGPAAVPLGTCDPLTCETGIHTIGCSWTYEKKGRNLPKAISEPKLSPLVLSCRSCLSLSLSLCFAYIYICSSFSLSLADNKFICDCRLQWIFELKNRTRHLQLRDSLEELICTLQEPKLLHFVDPVPSHILDILNVGGFTAIGSNSASMGGIGNSVSSVSSSSNYATLDELSGNGLSSRKHATSKSRQALRGQRQFTDDVDAENVVESKLLRQRRRKRQEQAAGGSNIIGGDLAAVAAHTQKRYDYYDENNGGGGGHMGMGLVGHGSTAVGAMDMDDNLNLHKQSSFYGASSSLSAGSSVLGNNDVDVMLQQPKAAGDALDSLASKHSINVRLFILKPEMLPCHDELSDPTELPLSRDLMDVRSNAGQDLLINGAAQKTLQLTLCLALSSAVALLSRG